jgi:hypothetical protein
MHNHAIFLVKLSPTINSLKMGVWNDLDEEQLPIEALPNCRQICSKSEIWNGVFEHLAR